MRMLLISNALFVYLYLYIFAIVYCAGPMKKDVNRLSINYCIRDCVADLICNGRYNYVCLECVPVTPPIVDRI